MMMDQKQEPINSEIPLLLFVGNLMVFIFFAFLHQFFQFHVPVKNTDCPGLNVQYAVKLILFIHCQLLKKLFLLLVQEVI